MRRSDLIAQLATIIERLEGAHPQRVAIDGRDAAGKTTVADELAAELGSRGVAVIRAGIDGWHQPSRTRYRLGRDSPIGYYRDSFDLEALRARLLLPLGPGGDRRYLTAVFDHVTDSPVEQPHRQAPREAVLLFDGVFLLRPELRDLWDHTIYLSVSPEVALDRGVRRDTRDEVEQRAVRGRYLARYLPAHDRYEADVSPSASADTIVDTTDLAEPVLVRTAER